MNNATRNCLSTPLTAYRAKFGYKLLKTIRFVISKAAEEFMNQNTVPTFDMSDSTEQAGLQALKEYRQGKTHPVDDVGEFVGSL